MFEAYKIGVTVALTNKVSQGLGLIRMDLKKTDAQAVALKKTMKEIKLLAVGGAALGLAGYALMKPLHASYEAAKEYEQAFAQFKALKLGDAVNADANKFARGTSLIGVSATGLMESLRDMHLVVNDYKDARMLAPFLAQMEYANKAVGGEKAGAFDEGQRRALGKVMEWRGGFQSVEQMELQGNMMQHVMSGTSFQVLPRDYRNFLSTGGTAAQQMNNKAFYYKSEPLIQMMGGNAVGTGAQTAYNRMILGMGAGSPGGKAYLELLDKLHLVKSDHIEKNRLTGKITKILPNFLKDSDLYKDDPYAFLEEKLVPALKAAGYDEKGIQTAVAQIYGRTGGKWMNQFHQRYVHGKIDSAVAIDEKAMGVKELLELAKTSPQGAEDALAASWKQLKIAAGEVLIPVVIPALVKLADGIRELGQTINRHPVRFQYLIYGFTGLAAALAFSGVVLTLKAAFIGLRTIMLFAPVVQALIYPLTQLAGVLPGLGTASGTAALALAPLSAALLGIAAAAGLIIYHKEVAGWLDEKAPWAGDALMKIRDTFDTDGLKNTPATRNSNRGGPGVNGVPAPPPTPLPPAAAGYGFNPAPPAINVSPVLPAVNLPAVNLPAFGTLPAIPPLFAPNVNVSPAPPSPANSNNAGSYSFTPPPPQAAKATIDVRVRDPYNLASVVTQAQTKASSGETISAAGFDGRQSYAPAGFNPFTP